MKPKAILIGAGSIGGSKPDHIDNENTGVLSHAHAIAKYCEPLAVIDACWERAEAVAKKWGFPACFQPPYATASAYGEAELLVIATPPETHLEVLRTAIGAGYRGTVLLEKPAGGSAETANRIASLAESVSIPVYVNYQRNYLQAYDAKLLEGEIGPRDAWRVVLHYCRGYRRDASHFFALLHKWGIDPGRLTLRGGIADFSEADLTVDAYGDRVTVLAHDGREADVFQIELYGNQGRAVYIDHGKTLEVYPHQKERTFGEYMAWSTEPAASIQTYLENGLAAVYKTVLEGGPGVMLRDAVKILEMMEYCT